MKSRTRLSDFTFTFHFHALEKEMATHSSVLAWRIPGTGEPGGLPSMASHRVGHDWSDLAAAVAQMIKNLPAMQRTQVRSLSWKDPLERGNGNPLQYSCLENLTDREAWWATVHGGHKESDTTEHKHCWLALMIFQFHSFVFSFCLLKAKCSLFLNYPI